MSEELLSACKKLRLALPKPENKGDEADIPSYVFEEFFAAIDAAENLTYPVWTQEDEATHKRLLARVEGLEKVLKRLADSQSGLVQLSVKDMADIAKVALIKEPKDG